MKNLEEIQQICQKCNNHGMSEEEYRIYDKYTTSLYEAWDQWSDEITSPFWEGEEKQEYPTESFKEDFYSNFEWDELT